MDSLSDVILQIYRAAREQRVDEFQDFALGVVRTIIPFDSSRWVTAEAVAGKKAVTRFAHLQNEPEGLVVDWEAVSQQDRFKDLMIANTGRAISIHSPSFFVGQEVAEVREYALRYRHANALGVITRASVPGHWDALSLFRAKSERHYDEAERHRLELLMPHLLEALEHNRLLGLSSAGIGEESERAASAIAHANGSLSYASGSFIHLLQQEWPDWNGHSLPRDLHDRLVSPDGLRFEGSLIDVSCSRLGELMFLRAIRHDPLQRLTAREALVARLYGDGLAYKEIAQRLEIAPATVRVFLQRIYGKLSISDKAQLAALLARQAQ